MVWLNGGNVKVGESGTVYDCRCEVSGCEDVVNSSEFVSAGVEPRC